VNILLNGFISAINESMVTRYVKELWLFNGGLLVPRLSV